MLKNIFINFADWLAIYAKRRAHWWLNVSRRFADFAEAIQAGVSIDQIQKEREH
ncbi:hypothetical protein [Bradyrhizobium cenepequi]|uniref:hypothetical protein n=1 Tax=Bradyrhizobium cenepequi TaxID=2821403 RepID=UPI001CE33767|nr:hypothetical protein [Bradyrhizobium cenepequi]MCA6108154.1 hypothetical protein [Bradyrhizobium cenepequi]